MKTKTLLFAAALIFSSLYVHAEPTKRTLTFRNALGRIIELPVKEEVASEDFPFEIENQISKASFDPHQVFDLSLLTKPEKEEELPFDPQKVLNEIR